MSDNSAIEWTDATWNPVTGCTKVSPGCDNCYAETLAERFRGTPGHYYENGFDVQLRPAKLDLPLHWTRPRRVFVNSMSDLFHDQVPDEYIAEVFAVMAAARQHTFQLLTKRHARMRSLLSSESFFGLVSDAIVEMDRPIVTRWPLPNVWMGVSVENQQWADIRVPALLQTPAAVRWLSCEPLLGSINLAVSSFLGGDWLRGLNWVVVGGESGRGARPMHPAWARLLRAQCTVSGIPFLFKQWGTWFPAQDEPSDYEARRYRAICLEQDGTIVPFDQEPADSPAVTMLKLGKHASGRELDGRTWDQYPAVAS